MPGRKYASAWSSSLPPRLADMVTNTQPMPMPNSAFITNWIDERCTSRIASSSSAAPMLTASASRSSRVVSHSTVNAIVGTAASSIPRRPPRAVASCLRTTSSTVSVVAGAGARGVRCRPRGVRHGMSS